MSFLNIPIPLSLLGGLESHVGAVAGPIKEGAVMIITVGEEKCEFIVAGGLAMTLSKDRERDVVLFSIPPVGMTVLYGGWEIVRLPDSDLTVSFLSGGRVDSWCLYYDGLRREWVRR